MHIKIKKMGMHIHVTAHELTSIILLLLLLLLLCYYRPTLNILQACLFMHKCNLSVNAQI